MRKQTSISKRRSCAMLPAVAAGILLQIQLAHAAMAADPAAVANGRNVLFVARVAGCSNGHTRAMALNPATPWCGLEGAVARLLGGDTVYVRSGIYVTDSNLYFLNRNFTAPVTIAGYPDERAVLGNYQKAYLGVPNTLWRREGGLWVTTVPVSVEGHAFLSYADGTMIWVHDSLAELKDPRSRPGAHVDAVNDRITLKLPAGQNPNRIPLYVASRRYQLFLIDNSSNIVLKNLTVRQSTLPVYIRNSRNIRVERLTIDGAARNGVYAFGSSDVRVTRNRIVFHPGPDWTWAETKLTLQENSGIDMQRCGANNKIDHNVIAGWFNGIIVHTGDPAGCANTYVHHNNISKINDDAIEIERYCNNSHYYKNLVQDAFVTVSLSPAIGRNCTVHRNVLLANRTIRARSNRYWRGACFKIKDPQGASGFTIAHNTCSGTAIGTNFDQKDPQRNMRWLNNLFYSTDRKLITKSGTARKAVLYDYNLYYRADGDYLFTYWNSDSDVRGYRTLKAALASDLAPGNWDRNSLNRNPLLNGYLPTSSSPVIDAGIDLGFDRDFYGNPVVGWPDLGAIEYHPGQIAIPPETLP